VAWGTEGLHWGHAVAEAELLEVEAARGAGWHLVVGGWEVAVAVGVGS
jgi:hypothetical protein